MSIVGFIRKLFKHPQDNHTFTDEERQESYRMKMLNNKIKELKYQQKIREMERVIADIEDDLYDDDEEDGSNPLDEQLTKTFMAAITQKLGGDTTPLMNSNSGVPAQFDITKVQDTFMKWASDHKIPQEKLLDLKQRLEA